MDNLDSGIRSVRQSIDRLIDESKDSHEGFTLVEMLIVVAILAVLMTIVFRLGSLGEQDSARTSTVVKMQKIENCLSGYYAAFGSYPPVPMHGWPDIYHQVDENGDQEEQTNTRLDPEQVIAACRCQPFGCEYPPSTSSADGPSEEQLIEEWAQEVQARVNDSSTYPNYAKGTWKYADRFDTVIKGPDVGTAFENEWENPDWKAIKLFKFGMMSYLLPRYLFMMGGDQRCFGIGYEVCAQWGDNNDTPSDPFTGQGYGWVDVIKDAQFGVAESSINRQDLARVANIPSQAVCARWMPNLENMCNTLKTMKFFGVQISNPNQVGLSPGTDDSPPDPFLHYPPGGSKHNPYKNATITINDGWGQEFFYHSTPPYQSYVVWSAGPNGRTFPPWASVESLDPGDRKTAMEWKNDDIMQMSH